MSRATTAGVLALWSLLSCGGSSSPQSPSLAVALGNARLAGRVRRSGCARREQMGVRSGPDPQQRTPVHQSPDRRLRSRGDRHRPADAPAWRPCRRARHRRPHDVRERIDLPGPDEESSIRKQAAEARSADDRSAAARRLRWLEPYISAKRLHTFDGDVELTPGISTIDAHGRTPGHTVYSAESKGQKIVFWGDLIHAAAIQFPYPTVAITFDTDSPQPCSSALVRCADAATGGYWVAAPHIPFPGIGHVEARGTGYAWVKAD